MAIAGVAQIFGLGDGEALCQSRGLCTTPEGRCLAWPNTLQHQVQPFELQDPSKPGHRKILCFFLVDPNKRVPSTLSCPPQQADWMKRYVSTECTPLHTAVRIPAHAACHLERGR